MGHSIIDRRTNSGTSDNRQRFLKRVKKHIMDSIPEVVSEETMEGLSSKKGYIKIPIKNTKEPEFSYDHSTGKKERILPGNKEFNKGDKLKKPNSGEGRKGRKGSNDHSVTEDEFSIILTREEFMQYFFEDLELPNLIKKSLNDLLHKKYERAGYSNDGSYNHLNVVKTYKKSLSRRLGISSYLKKKIEELKKLLLITTDEIKQKELQVEIDKLEKRFKSILFFDNIDLAYNFYEPHPKPISKAVMFMIMDVSGSMTEEHKDIAKRFFMLLYFFLKKNYQKVELVFIRHHSDAKEVTEDEFFNSRESGGTIVFPSLDLVNDIISERYNTDDVNLYCCQCSDGDVWDSSDANACKSFVEKELLKKLQYMAYIDIQPFDEDEPMRELLESDSELYNAYKEIESERFACKTIGSVEQIWYVFKELFSKETSK